MGKSSLYPPGLSIWPFGFRGIQDDRLVVLIADQRSLGTIYKSSLECARHELSLGSMNKRVVHANNVFMLPNRILVWREVRGCEKVYRFEGETAVGKLFNGLACIERFGVPNRNVSLSMSSLAYLILPFVGELRVAA